MLKAFPQTNGLAELTVCYEGYLISTVTTDEQKQKSWNPGELVFSRFSYQRHNLMSMNCLKGNYMCGVRTVQFMM